jgi:hypothetical protein
MIDPLVLNALKLSRSEQASLFRMLTEYAPILVKILPHSSLLTQIVNGVTPPGNSPIIQAYNAWKNSNQP